MPLFNIDLFISYAHIDNQPLSVDESGWITRLHESLDTLLSMRLGKNVRIWRDDKLQGNDHFAQEIVEQFKSTAVLVSILTPRYLNSEWCTREVGEFCTQAQNQLFVDHKARVFKIIKTPVDSESTLPSIMQELLGYEFFVLEDGVPMELDGVYGQQYGQDFNRKVNKLAYEISELLKKLESSDKELKKKPLTELSDKPVVYLAECTYDMKNERDAIESQLNCLGYQVLPDRVLPVGEQEYITAVNDLLERSQVSVHLIGHQYGAVPHGPNEESTAYVQNRLAADQSQSNNLPRLIWLGNEALTNSDRQQAFINELHSDAQSQRGADLLTGNVEKLKSALLTLLDSIEKQKNLPQFGDTGGDIDVRDEESSVYLICTEQDRKATVPLRKYLREQKISVLMPAFKGEAAQVRAIHQQLLTHSSHIMVFYGEGEEAWKRGVDTELKKLPAYLEGRSPPDIYTYLASPPTSDKDDMVDMDEPGMLNGLDGLNKISLDEIFSEASSVRDIS